MLVPTSGSPNRIPHELGEDPLTAYLAYLKLMPTRGCGYHGADDEDPCGAPAVYAFVVYPRAGDVERELKCGLSCAAHFAVVQREREYGRQVIAAEYP